jgi:hypothetical protein
MPQKTNNKINLEYCYSPFRCLRRAKIIQNVFGSFKAHEANPSAYTASRLAKYFTSFKKIQILQNSIWIWEKKFDLSKKITSFERSILDRNWEDII